MCGIAGLIDFQGKFKIDDTLLDIMVSPLKFRGPDQEGRYLHTNENLSFGLVHRRLSILDLSENGNQPMEDEEGKLVIVFNGEIYNYKSIRHQLKFQNFRSNSDTEVILYAIKEWGIEGALSKIEGMFAFALFDYNDKSLIICRDRFGEKPLYYYNRDQLFAFSSDIRSFSAIPFKKTLNTYSIGYYLGEMSTPGDKTIWSEVLKLPPSHYLKVTQTDTEIIPYWRPNYINKTPNFNGQSIKLCEDLLEEAVRKTLISDVPVGCFLSGGIDSSLVALYAARNSTERLKTFTVGFNFDRFNEAQYARYVANLIGSEHHEIYLDNFSLDEVNVLLKEYGEPFGDSSAIPTYFISKFASQHVKVCIGGDGGDELFGGYGSHNQAYRMQQWYSLKILKNILSKFSNSKKATYLKGVMNLEPNALSQALDRGMGFSYDQIMKLTGDSFISNSVGNEHLSVVKKALENTNCPFDVILNASVMTRLQNDYLVKTDRASMFNSLEIRTPFLDKGLFDFTSSLKFNQLMRNGINKYLTKTIAKKYFKKDFVDRPKMGFGVPIGEWMKKEWKNDFQEVLLSNLTEFPLNISYLEQIWQEHQLNKVDHSNRLWIIYVLKKWIKDHNM